MRPRPDLAPMFGFLCYGRWRSAVSVCDCSHSDLIRYGVPLFQVHAAKQLAPAKEVPCPRRQKIISEKTKHVDWLSKLIDDKENDGEEGIILNSRRNTEAHRATTQGHCTYSLVFAAMRWMCLADSSPAQE